MDSLTLAASVIEWHKDIDRNLPWKQNSSPYTIWVSEIILQQTQVVQGLRYYNRFIDQYPTLESLAASSESDLLKAWEGLGYNSRARNLHKAAKKVANDFEGVFPDQFEEILSLPGIGDYTASAIAAFAYELSHVAVDSNVERWVSRYFGISEFKSSLKLKRSVKELLQPSVENHSSPAECNQSFIDFGALVCTAKSPKCNECPVSETCYAFGHQQITDFPLAKPKKPRKIRQFHYLVAICDQKIAIVKREEKDIWQGMYEFPLHETEKPIVLSEQQLHDYFRISERIQRDDIQSYEQTLTHRIIQGKFYLCTLPSQSPELGQWMSADQLSKFAFAGIVRLYLADNMFIFNDIKELNNGK